MICCGEEKLSFVHMGHFISDGEWKHPSITMDMHEIIFVLEGDVHIREEEQYYELKKDDILYLAPYKFHEGTEISKENVSFYWLHFTGGYIPNSNYYFAGKDAFEIKSLFKRLLHVSNTNGYKQSTKDALVMLIIDELNRLAAEKTEAVSPIAATIHEYVRINCKNNISVASVANHFNYNENYLGKLFKRYYGMGLKEYIDQEKIKFAKDKLLTTTHSVKAIASMLGYEDEKLFIKFFSYHEKISPAKYRKLYYNTHINNY